MAITSFERFPVRVSTKRGQRVYLVQGTDDEADALNHLQGVAPTSWNSLPRREVSVEHLAPETWEGVVTYASRFGSSDTEVTYDGTGGTERVLVGTTVSSTAAPGFSACDFKGAINVNEQGPQGVEIVVPRLRMTIRTTIDAANWTTGYVENLQGLTGTWNQSAYTSPDFITYAAGTLLFLGPRSRIIPNSGDVELELSFSISPNRSNIDVGDSITVPSKQGHDFLWAYFPPVADASGCKQIVRQPTAAYVVRVYEPGDYSQLGV